MRPRGRVCTCTASNDFQVRHEAVLPGLSDSKLLRPSALCCLLLFHHEPFTDNKHQWARQCAQVDTSLSEESTYSLLFTWMKAVYFNDPQFLTCTFFPFVPRGPDEAHPYWYEKVRPPRGP